jgi:hypothetical protein
MSETENTTMRFRRTKRALLASALFSVAALAGCGGGGGGGGDGQTNFDDFVIGIVQNRTSDTAEPVDVADKTFRFDEDPTAFDTLFR